MQSGLINKIAITPANKTDAEGFSHVCPTKGTSVGDKGYCVNPALRIAKSRGVHLAAIKKANMKEKNKDLIDGIVGSDHLLKGSFQKERKEFGIEGYQKINLLSL